MKITQFGGDFGRIIYKNTSKMDEDEITLFQNYAMKKTTIISSVAFTLFFVLFGIGLSFVILPMGIILIVCGCIGGLIFMPYLLKDSVKKQNTQNLGDRKYLNTFEFYENSVLVTTEATSSKETNDYKPIANQTINYNELYQLVVYKAHLFLFISPGQSFILSFKGMTKGTYQDVIDLIKSKGVKIIDKTNVAVPATKN